MREPVRWDLRERALPDDPPALASDKIYVGQLTVLGSVKGGPFDDGHATLEAATIAGKFWDLYKARSEVRAEIG